MADEQNKPNNPLINRPKDEDQKDEGKDLIDYSKTKEFIEENTGETLEIDENRPAPNPTAPSNPNAEGPFVKYTGYATLRVITPSAWKEVGVHDTGRKEWNYLNAYKVPKSELSEGALEYLLNKDGRFELVDE